MKKTNIIVIGCLVIALGITAAVWLTPKPPAVSSDKDLQLNTIKLDSGSRRTIATVGSIPITSDQLDWEISLHINAPKITDTEALASKSPSSSGALEIEIDSPAKDSVTAALQKRMLVALIERKLLYSWIRQFADDFDHENPSRFVSCVEKAQEYATSKDPLLSSELGKEMIRQKLCEQSLIQQYVNEKLYTKVRVSEKEISNYFEKNRSEFRSGVRVKFLQILLPNEDVAKTIRSKVNRDNFRELARKHSIASEALEGGIVGPFTKDQLPVFFEPVFKMPLLEISDIIKSDYGFHIVMPIERLPAKNSSLIEARPAIAAKIKLEHQQALFHEWLNKAMNAIPIRNKTSESL